MTKFPHFLNFFIFIFSCPNSCKSAEKIFFHRGVPPSDHQNLENIHNISQVLNVTCLFVYFLKSMHLCKLSNLLDTPADCPLVESTTDLSHQFEKECASSISWMALSEKKYFILYVYTQGSLTKISMKNYKLLLFRSLSMTIPFLCPKASSPHVILCNRISKFASDFNATYPYHQHSLKSQNIFGCPPLGEQAAAAAALHSWSVSVSVEAQ